MAFDIRTYSPGDAWETTEFLTRGMGGINISALLSAPGEVLGPTYVEYRSSGTGNQRFVEISVMGVAPFEAQLQRSLDGGTTWGTVNAYQDIPVEETMLIGSLQQIRIQHISGNDVQCRIKQDL